MFTKQKPSAAVLEAFTRRLDEKKIAYSAEPEKGIVRVRYNGEYFRAVSFTFMFDSDGTSFGLRVYSIAQFTRVQLEDAYEFCNRMNEKFRWLRLFVDEDRELTAALDAVITPATARAVCTGLLHRAVNIVDSVCKELND